MCGIVPRPSRKPSAAGWCTDVDRVVPAGLTLQNLDCAQGEERPSNEWIKPGLSSLAHSLPSRLHPDNLALSLSRDIELIGADANRAEALLLGRSKISLGANGPSLAIVGDPPSRRSAL